MSTRAVFCINLIISAYICCLIRPSAAASASITDYTSQFSKLATARSETLAIMGGDDGASGGTYKFYDDGTTMTITKLGGKGTLGEPRSIGETGLTWLPQMGGNVGYISGENKYLNNPILVGNTETFSTLALGLEAGAKINLSKELSLGPTLGLIYAHSTSTFEPGTVLGAHLKQVYSRQLFDWDIDTIALVPSMDIHYEKVIDNDWKLTLSSRFAWFNTWGMASSSDYLRGGGSSYDWENKADLDVRLPIKLLGFPLHTGGYVSIDILGDDFRDTVGSNAMYTFNGRLVVGDITGMWKLNWLGLGASYIKANTFYGYSIGLDARLQF